MNITGETIEGAAHGRYVIPNAEGYVGPVAILKQLDHLVGICEPCKRHENLGSPPLGGSKEEPGIGHRGAQLLDNFG